MKTEVDEIFHVFDRDIYWTRIIFSSDDMSISTVVFAAASSEYLEDYYAIPGDQRIAENHFSDWVQRIIQKWSESKSNIFKQNIHYDIYAGTLTGESNILDFLLEKTR